MHWDHHLGFGPRIQRTRSILRIYREVATDWNQDQISLVVGGCFRATFDLRIDHNQLVTRGHNTKACLPYPWHLDFGANSSGGRGCPRLWDGKQTSRSSTAKGNQS